MSTACRATLLLCLLPVPCNFLRWLIIFCYLSSCFGLFLSMLLCVLPLSYYLSWIFTLACGYGIQVHIFLVSIKLVITITIFIEDQLVCLIFHKKLIFESFTFSVNYRFWGQEFLEIPFDAVAVILIEMGFKSFSV